MMGLKKSSISKPFSENQMIDVNNSLGNLCLYPGKIAIEMKQSVFGKSTCQKFTKNIVWNGFKKPVEV